MRRIGMLAVVCFSFSALAVFAQETQKSNPPAPNSKVDPKADIPAATVKPEQLEQWTRDLVDAKFTVRQTASQKLIEAGVPGMEAVAKAADAMNLELASRCLAVLSEGLAAKDEAVRKAAKEALQRLTKSENKSVAQRAQQALDTPIGPLPGGVAQDPRRRAFPGGVNNIALRFQINNGARETKINENGKEIVIKDNNGKDISVMITETINGNKKVTNAAGKDADDLKKNNPDAHAYFEKYCKGNGIRMQIGGNGIGLPAAPGGILVPAIPRRVPRAVNPFKAADLFDEIEKLRQKIDEANEKIQKAADVEQPNAGEIKKLTEEIKAATKRLAEIKTESDQP